MLHRCKNYLRNNNYCEEAITKMNDLLTESVNDLQKIVKVDNLVLSKKTLRKPIEGFYNYYIFILGNSLCIIFLLIILLLCIKFNFLFELSEKED